MHDLQNTFIGGLDNISPDTQIPDNSYYYLVNARQRLGSIKPNNKPLQIATIPAGLKQGIISLGTILIAFVSGKAYYNIDGTVNWIKIPSFLMDENVDRYYSIAVPEGKVNYIRKLNPDGNIGSSLIKSYDFEIQGNPASILVQDGSNQPWIIEYDPTIGLFSSRETSDYDGWDSATNREYVPIGKQMMLVDSKLYIVEPNGHFIYQSISGRYLDFMVNVNVDGDKLMSETQGGAASVSFNFDSDEITAITPADIPSSFLYCTSKFVRIITLDYSRLIFGEPTYYTTTPLKVGVVNQDSIISILGDTALIDFENVKSFNAVQQLYVEGNNSIFSLQLAKLLNGVKQKDCRAVFFNNYALFDLDTRKGRLIAVYDTLLEKWVSFDITVVFAVKQFAIVETITESKLYAINVNDELYQLYASDEVEIAQLYTRSFAAVGESEYLAQKSEFVKLYFDGGSVDGRSTVIELVDGKEGQRIYKLLPENLAGISFPMTLPFIFGNEVTCEPLTYTLTNGKKGYKISYIVQWNTDAQLQAIEIKTSNDTPVVAGKQAERVLTNVS